LAVFPGLAIFLVLYSFNTLGDILSTYQRNQK
jgi:ABC-type dipeptide/oligopeptide/nickel transport system permease subunit